MPEGLVDVSQLKALDLPNVRLAGSYATGKATPKSDVDILVGLTDDEWSRVAPHEPPEAVNRLFSILPEDSLDVKLYKLSDVKDMWYFKRGRRGISGVFVPVDDAEMVQGLWNSSIGLKEIPPAVSVVEYDRQYSLETLREMAKGKGLSPSGSKKEIAARLIAKGVK